MNWSLEEIRFSLGALALDVSLSGSERTVALIGPNGSGKSTLLRTIAGGHCPDAGRIQIGERALFDASAGINVLPEARGLGYVPQTMALFPHLDVLDNTGFGLRKLAGRKLRDQRRAVASGRLEELGCAHLAERRVSALSAGEARQVALARALITEPDWLLLDEPLSALDASVRRELRGYLAAHFRSVARPTLVVTHDVRDVRAWSAWVVVLAAGRVVQQGPYDQVAAQPANDFVAEFFYVDTPDGEGGPRRSAIAR